MSDKTMTKEELYKANWLVAVRTVFRRAREASKYREMWRLFKETVRELDGENISKDELVEGMNAIECGINEIFQKKEDSP